MLSNGHEPGTRDSTMATRPAATVELPLTVDYRPDVVAAALAKLKPAAAPSDVTLLGLDEPGSVPLGPAAAPAVRHSVPGYEILRELGRGGMGVVYQARQKGLNRLVALKMILAGDHAGSGERERFYLEAEAVASLQHPNIVQIFEIGEADGRPYLAFEFIEGGTLAQHLGGNPWPARAAASLIEALARAVQFAHDVGIVHRDLKPGNIMLAAGKQRDRPESPADSKKDHRAAPPPLTAKAIPKITDFGLAKRLEKDSDWSSSAPSDEQPGKTRTGAVMGTPSYIAPEQAAGKNRDVGPAVDIYALGAILYELLTGRPPFRGETPLDTVLQVMSDDPVPPRGLQSKVPRDLDTICMKCLEKAPAKRYASAGDLADDLRRFLNLEPIAARPSASYERLSKWAKRHPAVATSLFIGVVAVFATLGISFYFNFALRQSAEAKDVEAKKAHEAQRAAERSAYEKDQQTQYANDQKQKADERLKDVEKARREAEANHQEALKREETARRTAYALALNRAMALVERDPFRAALLLDRRDECPPELHDFTWRFLRAMCRVDDPRTLEGHSKTITQVVWSPDGTRLATASLDGTARVWDARSHRLLATLRGHRGFVRAIGFAPDGATLATAGNDHRLNLWELPALAADGTGAPIALAPWASLDAGDVQALAIAPDGAHVAAGANDGVIHVFSVPPLPRLGMAAAAGGVGALIARLPDDGHAPGGALIALPSKPAAEDVLKGHKGTVTSLVWREDGLFSGGFDTTVRRWKPGIKLEGEVVYKNDDKILNIAVSRNGDLLAVAGSSSDNNSIKLWNLRLSNQIARLRGHIRAVYSVRFSPDGKHLASASDDGTVRIWDTSSGQETSVYRGHNTPVHSVAFAPERPILASAGRSQSVLFWKLNTPHEETHEIDVHAPDQPAPRPGAAITPDGRRLAFIDRDNSIKVWDRDGNGFPKISAFALRGMPGTAATFALSPKGDLVAAASNLGEDATIAVWAIPDAHPKQRQELKSPRKFKENGEVHSLALNGRLLAVAGSAGVRVWNLDTRKLLLNPLAASVNCAAFTPDGKKLIGALDRSLIVWDVATGKEEHRFAVLDIQGVTIAVGPAIGGKWPVAVCDQQGAAKIWALTSAKQARGDDRTVKLEEVTFLNGHAEPITSVAFTKDGKTIATSSDDRTVRLWDPITGRERCALTSHTDSVLLIHFEDNDSTLLSLGRDGALKLWRAPK
jgi:eukaryotic-like serine/threonine-protein kinase